MDMNNRKIYEGSMMIRDLELIKDIAPLFEKKIVVWGIGFRGRQILQELKAIGAGMKGIYLCDSNKNKCSAYDKEKLNLKEEILLPEILQQKLCKFRSEDIIILVSVADAKVQDEILKIIDKIFGNTIDIYTEFAVKWGIYYNINHPFIKEKYRREKLEERKRNRNCSVPSMDLKLNAFRYFSFLPLYQNEIILVYQVGKVGSTSIFKSLQNYNRYALHCHSLMGIEEKQGDLYNLLNMKSAKIISLVREPISRLISAMWQSFCEVERYALDADFFDVERYFFGGEKFEDVQFEWFHREMKKLLKIDVFQYPFDQQQGYSLIKEGNIELLLMKMEKLNDLDDVVGSFLGIKDFHILNSNVGKEKSYRFAYKEYKKNFSAISEEKIKEIYKQNEYMKFFYSEQEREELFNKWIKYADCNRSSL